MATTDIAPRHDATIAHTDARIRVILVLVLGLLLLAAALATPGVARAGGTGNAEPTAHDDAQLEVVESTMALEIRDRVPHDTGARFVPGQKVYAFVAVRNPGEETGVELVWKHDGQERWRIALDVGHSSRGWRTWAYKTIRDGDDGAWTVEVHAPSGQLLETLSFEVAASPDEAAL